LLICPGRGGGRAREKKEKKQKKFLTASPAFSIERKKKKTDSPKDLGILDVGRGQGGRESVETLRKKKKECPLFGMAKGKKGTILLLSKVEPLEKESINFQGRERKKEKSLRRRKGGKTKKLT